MQFWMCMYHHFEHLFMHAWIIISLLLAVIYVSVSPWKVVAAFNPSIERLNFITCFKMLSNVWHSIVRYIVSLHRMNELMIHKLLVILAFQDDSDLYLLCVRNIIITDIAVHNSFASFYLCITSILPFICLFYILFRTLCINRQLEILWRI